MNFHSASTASVAAASHCTSSSDCDSDDDDFGGSKSRMPMCSGNNILLGRHTVQQHGHFDRWLYENEAADPQNERLRPSWSHNKDEINHALGYNRAHSFAEEDDDGGGGTKESCARGNGKGDLQASLTNFYGYVPTMKHAAAPLTPPSEQQLFHRPSQLPTSLEPFTSPVRKLRQSCGGRVLGRRGGACHSDLLKNAVLATMESYEYDVDDNHNEEDNRGTSSTRNRLNSMAGSLSELTIVTASTGSYTDAEDSVVGREARKRSRITGDQDDHAEDSAGSDAMADDCISRQVPGNHYERHVARRTSKEQELGVMQSPRGSIDQGPSFRYL